MKFNIINIKTEEKLREFTAYWYGTEEQADAKLSELNVAGSPPTYRKKVIITDDWVRRECDNMLTIYNTAQPIWMLEGHAMEREVWYDRYDGWSNNNIKIKHFAIVSQSDPLFISYFPDEEKGMLGKRVKIAPGKYLKKYFGHIYSDREIEDYANRHKEKYAEVKVQWATTPDEIAAVYKMPFSGFNSCMQKPDDYFNNTIKRNPTFTYGAGDLAVAYVVRDGVLNTRALVWREQNKVGRVYGDSFILRAGLAKEGIETNSNNGVYDTFEGARLLKVYHEFENKKMVIAPYIDGSPRNLKEDGDYLVISEDGRYHAEWTDGMARPRPFCERLQTFVRETVMVNVWSDEDNTYHLQEWSRDTEQEYMVHIVSDVPSSYLNNNSRYYKVGSPDLFPVRNYYGEIRYFTKRYHEAYSDMFFTSDISGKLHYEPYTAKYMVEGKVMTEVERNNHAFRSKFDGEYYLIENKVSVEGAGSWHIDQARKHAKQAIEGDDTLFTLKKGFIFSGGKVIKKPKPSSKFSHLINYEGARKLSNSYNLEYDYRHNGPERYITHDGIYLQASNTYDVWETNAPISLFELDELV